MGWGSGWFFFSAHGRQRGREELLPSVTLTQVNATTWSDGRMGASDAGTREELKLHC